MATYDADLYIDAFENMADQRKTIYVLINKGAHGNIVSGDRVEFGSYGSITVGMVRRYPNLEALVAAEGWQSLVPEADSAEEALDRVRAVPEWTPGDELSHGVIALRVRSVKRKSAD